jgi:hypothetical protein
LFYSFLRIASVLSWSRLSCLLRVRWIISSALAHYPDSEPISLCSYSLKLRSGELEKHQIPILLSLVWPYRNPNLWSTVLEASTINVTMTTPMRFWENNKTITTQFTGSLRFSQFSDCWLILSVYILEFWLSLWKIVRSSVILLLPCVRDILI